VPCASGRLSFSSLGGGNGAWALGALDSKECETDALLSNFASVSVEQHVEEAGAEAGVVAFVVAVAPEASDASDEEQGGGHMEWKLSAWEVVLEAAAACAGREQQVDAVPQEAEGRRGGRGRGGCRAK